MYGLLATKIHRPSIPANWVQRPHLIQRLNEGLENNRQVTLVSAPAGFGKTTCISEWVNLLDRPLSWLSLEPADDDPGRFFAYCIAALQQVDANLGQEIEGVIQSGHLPPAEIISATLINDILAFEDRFLLVLDDFHVIQDRLILQVFEELLSNFPNPLHLVLITREDPPLPLARLRANNRLTEIRARDLRFTRRDIDRFTNEVMGLSLSQADIAVLEDKTEGWIAGLQLAALAWQAPLSAQVQAHPSSFIATLSGSHRFILSYLTEQVLHQQPEEIQQFLLQTSILDRLNGDVCNAVSGRSDSHTLLEQLFKANLFLISLDDERRWYRYHHLFADLLRDLQNAFPKETTTELHRRASHWFVQAGMLNEAIQHALAAENYATAVDLLESHALDMIMQGYAKTIKGWVQLLPAEWGSRSPRTNLAFAWALLLRGDYSQASEYLERLRATLIDAPSGEESPSVLAEWMVMQSLVLYMQGKTTECMEMANQALALAPELDSRVRSMAYYVQASLLWLQENYQQATEIFQKSIQYSRAAENLVAEMMSTAGLTGMALENGQLHLAFEIASQAVERIERSGMLHPITAIIYASLGEAHYHWYHIKEARHNFERALHLSIQGGSNTISIFCYVLLSRLYQIEGDLNTAKNEIQKAVDLLPFELPEYVRQGVVSQQVRIYLALDRPKAAEIALQRQVYSFGDNHLFSDLLAGRISPVTSYEGVSYSIGQVFNSILSIFLYQARAGDDPTRLKSGIEFADRVIEGAFRSKQIVVALETLLLRAQMKAVLGDLPASAADYVRVLELAEPEGFISIFVGAGRPVAEDLENLARQNQLVSILQEYVKRILEVISRLRLPGEYQPTQDFPIGIEKAVSIEQLTDRELDVLRLMAEGLKYKEIAERLFISLNTVRYHVKSIYGKLNVSNRIQAIDIARQLRLM